MLAFARAKSRRRTKKQIAVLLLQNLENTTMNELPKLIRQHYEKNDAGASPLSKVTKILDSLPDGAVAFSRLAGLNQFHVMGLAATEQLAQIAALSVVAHRAISLAPTATNDGERSAPITRQP